MVIFQWCDVHYLGFVYAFAAVMRPKFDFSVMFMHSLLRPAPPAGLQLLRLTRFTISLSFLAAATGALTCGK